MRCAWAGSSPLMAAYHDEEWGRPSHDDRHLFELLVLEGAQAGLSWATVLARRPGYRAAFADFDIAAVAAFDEARVEALVSDPGIVRHRQKVRSAVGNARAVLAIADEHGSLDAYVWGWVGGEPIQNHPSSPGEVPTTSPLARELSRDLARRGCTWVGPTTTYSYLQAVGVVDDHLVGCPAKPTRAGAAPRPGGEPVLSPESVSEAAARAPHGPAVAPEGRLVAGDGVDRARRPHGARAPQG